jgi:hypothetical protein
VILRQPQRCGRQHRISDGEVAEEEGAAAAFASGAEARAAVGQHGFESRNVSVGGGGVRGSGRGARGVERQVLPQARQSAVHLCGDGARVRARARRRGPARRRGVRLWRARKQQSAARVVSTVKPRDAV